MHPPIPEGWYRLAHGERILAGDMCWSAEFRHDNEWKKCVGLVGGQVGVQVGGYKDVIRKGKTQPGPEKIWLNPWD